jgi:hypothetical protein
MGKYGDYVDVHDQCRNGLYPYLKLEELEIGGIYALHSRNLPFGVWNGDGFVGIRNKFGRFYLFQEFHADNGGIYGTVFPMERMAVIKDYDDLREGHWTEDHEWDGNIVLFNILFELEQGWEQPFNYGARPKKPISIP